MVRKTLLTTDFNKKTKREKKFSREDEKNLLEQLDNAKSEADVQDAWRDFLFLSMNKYKVDPNDKFEITPPDNHIHVDGLITGNNIVFALKLLLEFKYNKDLNDINERAHITAQCVHYMRLLNDKDGIRPNVICGADESQAFILYAPNFYSYIESSKYNWDCSPRGAYEGEDPKLVRDLLVDKNLAVWVYEFRTDKPKMTQINLTEMLDEITKLAQTNGNEYQVKVTESNIAGMFSEFKRIVLEETNKKNKVIPTPRESVTIFMKLLIGDNKDYYLHPNMYNKLHLPNGKLIDVNGIGLKTFFKHFNRRLKPKEQDHLLSMSDRLIEDETRRRKGDFWTPTIWANKADEMLSEAFGKDYKDKDLVWDCAAGTKNLTRDFVYGDLYTSTIYQSEIDLGEKYNPEAKASFQYDFLNDDINLNPTDNPDPNEWKMPNSLFNELISASKTGKRIIFYTNPPYGTANDFGKFGKSKRDIANTKVKKYMQKVKYGNASQQLYAQFFARIIKLTNDFHLTNVGIGFFTMPRFFAGGSYWRKFNAKFFDKFKLIKGIMISSGEFSDTADTWPIIFAVYGLNKNNDQTGPLTTFKLEKSDWDQQKEQMIIAPGRKGNIQKTMRMVYPPQDLSTWVRETTPKKVEEVDYSYPYLGSAMGESKGKTPNAKLLKGSIGYLVLNANNVGKGTKQGSVFLLSSCAYMGHGLNVFKDNFERSIVAFAARRAVKPTWYNVQDNYKKPDTNNETYKELVKDALVFSLFDTESDQAAYRGWKNYCNLPNAKYKWANQWFWLNINTVRDLANDYDQQEVYDDTRGDTNRYVANLLNKVTLSTEGQNLLNVVNDILESSMSDRRSAILAYDDLSLNAWDAGWYQLKQLIKKFPNKENQQLMNRYRQVFEILRSKIENEVYDLDMLIK